MPHNAAFYQGLHSLLRHDLQIQKCNFYMEIIICDPHYIQWTIPNLLYQIKRKNLFVHKGLN